MGGLGAQHDTCYFSKKSEASTLLSLDCCPHFRTSPKVMSLHGKGEGTASDPYCLRDLKADGKTVPGLEKVGGQSSNDCKQHHSQHDRHHNGHHIGASPFACWQWVCCSTFI